MLTYTTGNILDADTQALVNTVNTVGVMGKGIALQFATAFPGTLTKYKKAVKEGKLTLGTMFITKEINKGREVYIINFPTKSHWRHPSKYEWIIEGLRDLRKVLEELKIESVAIPPLGSGHGGLHWPQVKAHIEKELAPLLNRVRIVIYEPAPRHETSTEGHLKHRKKVNLTNVRAKILYMLYQYRVMGEYATEFATQKLGYLLERAGDQELRLEYKKGHYGPYSEKIPHILYDMNGYYLKGLEGRNLGPFEPFQLVVAHKEEVFQRIEELPSGERNYLDSVTKLIEGFETPFGLELLTTVDFVAYTQGSADTASIREYANKWSERKKALLTDENIALAKARMDEVSSWRLF